MFDTRMSDVDGAGSDFVSELEPDDNTLVLAGMSATLCVESHLRDAVENGFEVLAVTDATAAAGEDALEAALTNYNFIAHETATTDEVVDRLAAADTRATGVSTTAEPTDRRATKTASRARLVRLDTESRAV